LQKRTVFPADELAEVAVGAGGENENPAFGPDNLMGKGWESLDLHGITVN
jgi:hypothetical protein